MVIDTNSKINSGSLAGTRNHSATAPLATPGGKNPAAAVASPAKDNVVLSQEAQSLNRLQASINKAPDVDAERVAALKQAIADGRFAINADRIAENMLKQDDLLG